MRSPPPLETALWRPAGIRINTRRRIKEANRELQREPNAPETIGSGGGKAAMKERHISFAEPFVTEIEPRESFPLEVELDVSREQSQTALISWNSSPIAEGLDATENPSNIPPSRPYDDAGALPPSKTHKIKASGRQKVDLETPTMSPPRTRKRKELDLPNNATLDTTVESGSTKDVGEPRSPNTKALCTKKRRTSRS
ncbi:hypothetical protein M427DRAFT_140254 [Gonapodya prolifera JEL478]|uniref:Uncharacterized protein n=1 Tax=Gonapodya prolifera (strain JEL478) TaxID=1344416 RepID=A0A138ZZK6_GONPJ|nr:hypothetical protein M427DRAFT_140254 [Gonapodya prolifera JEL478]|eukprot:KXS09930.1 hypothetical protein M427DRAFT_140254 [Gonapodya prolifera JEL478]